MIYTVTLNPAMDKTVEIDGLETGGVNRITSLRVDAGGKGINVSKVLGVLGSESVAMGIVGGNTGLAIENYLTESGIGTDFVKVGAETRTNMKIIDTKKHVNTDINEQGITVDGATIGVVEEKLRARLKKGDIAVLAGSVPKGTPVTVYERLVRLCNSYEAYTFLDVDGVLLTEGIKACPYLIKPNIDELERIVGHKLPTVRDVARVAKELIAGGISKVIVSLGGDGALFCDSEKIVHAHGLHVNVRSTVGAGDSMVAALCHALANGYGFEDTVKLAIATSAANVTCSGTQPAEMAVIKPLINQVSWENVQ